MEAKTNSAAGAAYDGDDALSFCEFSMHTDDYDNYSSPRKYPDTPDSLFEFFIDSDFEPHPSAAAVVFCGKTIDDLPSSNQPELVQRDPRNGLFLFKTNSFKRSQSFRSAADLAKSTAFNPNLPATGSCRYRSSKSRKSLIGSLVKPQPKMELGDIRRRQSRRTPAPMFPVGEELVAADECGGGSGRAHQKGLIRPLRCRSHLVSALVKASFGCIPSPRPV